MRHLGDRAIQVLTLVVWLVGCTGAGAGASTSSEPGGGPPTDSAEASAKRIPLPANGGGIVVVGDILWVATDVGAVRVDPATGEVTEPIAGVTNLAFDGTRLWAGGEGTLMELEPLTGEVLQQFDLDYAASYLAATPTAVWASDTAASTVHRIDPADGRTVAAIDVPTTPKGTEVGHGSIWIACDAASKVVRIDPTTNEIAAEIEVGDGPHTIAIGREWVWVTIRGSSTLSKIDPLTNEVLATVADVARSPAVGVAVSEDAVYVAYYLGIARVDPEDAVVTDRIVVSEAQLFYDLKVVGETLWGTDVYGRMLYGFDIGGH
jgi:streptogramin lyase